MPVLVSVNFLLYKYANVERQGRVHGVILLYETRVKVTKKRGRLAVSRRRKDILFGLLRKTSGDFSFRLGLTRH